DRTAVLNPLHSNGWFGVGPPFGMAGIPSIQYIPQPNYLCVGAANGCIEKLSSDLFYRQLKFFTKIVHRTNSMTADQLRGKKTPAFRNPKAGCREGESCRLPAAWLF